MKSSLKIPERDPCPFCDYLAGNRPYTILARNPVVATLVTREQRGIAHLLILPIRHRVTLLDLTDHESNAVMKAVVTAVRVITAAYEPEGVSVWQNNGIPASQTIPHVHFHVAGTLPAGGTDWNEVAELPVAETDAIAKRLRVFLH